MGMTAGIVGGAILVFVCAIAAYRKAEQDGFIQGAEEVIDAAVFLGHAEYYLDENNARQWRWKQPPGGE